MKLFITSVPLLQTLSPNRPATSLILMLGTSVLEAAPLLIISRYKTSLIISRYRTPSSESIRKFGDNSFESWRSLCNINDTSSDSGRLVPPPPPLTRSFLLDSLEGPPLSHLLTHFLFIPTDLLTGPFLLAPSPDPTSRSLLPGRSPGPSKISLIQGCGCCARSNGAAGVLAWSIPPG